MNNKMEELYLEAEADIRNNSYVEAFRKYESILYEEPGNGPTLNSLGWLYKTQIEDYKKAEKFYLACMNSSPNYPHAYINYAVLLTDMERFEELAKHLEKCLTIATIDKSMIYFRYGTMEELKLSFREAITYYEKAILVSLNDEKIKEYQDNISRCKVKMELETQHSSWFKKLKL
jgi:tetratricopeptide (TPR) repeat protein